MVRAHFTADSLQGAPRGGASSKELEWQGIQTIWQMCGSKAAGAGWKYCRVVFFLKYFHKQELQPVLREKSAFALSQSKTRKLQSISVWVG